MHTPALPRTRTAFLIAALLLAPSTLPAESIIFKDGFVLNGRVVRQQKTIIDPVSNTPVELAAGFFMVDDGARAIIFSPAHLQDVEGTHTPPEVVYKHPMAPDSAGAAMLPAASEILEYGPWDDRWDRVVKFRTTDGRTTSYNQHVQYLDPIAFVADAYPRAGLGERYRGATYYLTRELGAEGAMTLLGLHPKLKETRDLRVEQRAEHRRKRIHFLILTGWHEEAAQQLLQAAKEFPADREKFEAMLKDVRTLQRIDRVADFERAWAAGRHQWVRKQMADFDPQGLPDQTRRRFQGLQVKADNATDQLKEAARLLKVAVEGITLPEQKKVLGEAATAVLAEVSAETVSRLETFVTQAQQAEREKKAGQPPKHQPPELVAFAVTGWMLGNTASESKVDIATRLWNARQMIHAYERETDPGARQKLLAAWKADKDLVLAFDELAQVMALLPPPEPEEKITESVTGMTALRRGGRKYQLQLPSEYRHGRSYPVLIVCHSATETARDALDRWSTLAWEHGYILASPEWAGRGGFAASYGFTSDERLPVLETLRDLKRRFNVDSDRVFLAGFGVGGDMCFDVAVSHPDLFAGVLPMTGTPAPVVNHSCRNAQYLPFYVTTGDRAGDPYKETYRIFRDHWILQKYPMLFVTYKGRGAEYFSEELRPSFEWMRNKRRVFPLKQLGVPGGSEFVTARPEANRFYWLSTDALLHTVDGPTMKGKKGGLLQGNIGENQINVRPSAVKQISIWLGRDRAGQHMIDLEKPVTVYVGPAKRMRKTVTPSIETMMEDLYERGDRNWLFYARLDFNL